MKFDENLAAIHAYLCADGYVIKNPSEQKLKYYHIGFRNTELVLLKDFQKRFSNYFKISPHLIEGQRCRIGSRELYEKLTNQFGSFYSWEWSMPKKLNRNLMKIWLKAYFDCEGWVTVKTHQNRMIGLDCVNQDGIEQVKKKLEDMQIKCKIKKRETRNIYSLSIYGKANLIKFKKLIGFLHPRKAKKLEEAIKDYVTYEWNFPTINEELATFTKNLMKEKAKIKKGQYVFRVVSNMENNLLNLQRHLDSLFNIESRINKRVNGIGTVYFQLDINKKEEVGKLITNDLVKEEYQRAWKKFKK